MPDEKGHSKVTSVPFIGTTWYTGGPAYWLRRAGISLFLLALLAPFGAIAVGLPASMLGDPYSRPPGVAMSAFVLVATAVGFVWMWRRAQREWSGHLTTRELDREDRAAILEILGLRVVQIIVLALILLGVFAGVRWAPRVVLALVGFTFFALAVSCFGLLLAMFVLSLVREPNSVRVARQELPERRH